MPKIKSTQWDGKSPAKWVHIKVDGHFTRVVVSGSGRVTVATSRPTDITKHCLKSEWFRPFLTTVPKSTTILGELYTKGGTASDVKTLLLAGSSKLLFRAFAVETMAADATLTEVQAFCHAVGVPFLPFRAYEGESAETLLSNLPPRAEGYVLKDGNLLNWRKLKLVLTIDLIVDGFTEGAGKHLGAIGAIKCNTIEGICVANVGGMSDEVRYDMTILQDELIGQVCEVKYSGVGSKGRLRFPRFIRWRADKLPEQCGLAQDLELEYYWHNTSEGV